MSSLLGPRITEKHAQIAVAQHFGWRSNLIVPNVSWGLSQLLYREVDLMIVHPSGFCDEVEIKISVGDLKADAKKRHAHKSDRLFRRLWFAIWSEKIHEEHYVHIPEQAGILTMYHREPKYFPKEQLATCDFVEPVRPRIRPKLDVNVVRVPKVDKQAQKLDEKSIRKLKDLMAMRYWSLSEHVMNK
jgi:hypothetical protein